MNQLWNMTKTTLLLAMLTGFFVVVGGLLGGTNGMIIALVFAAAINMAAWWFSDKMALKMSRAREVTPQEAPELHRLVEVLAKRAGIPKPGVHIIDSPTPNAFATGRSPAKGAVAATTGLMQMLNRDELAGVMAHEIAHIKNRDTLISSIAATIAGAISMIADMAIWSMIFSGGNEEEGGSAGAGGFLMLILAPIAALIIQMAISRSREFVADAEGARILGDPQPLADALRKLEIGVKQRPMNVSPATSHLYIVNPVFGGMAGLFSTHPATEKRIARLQEMRSQFKSEMRASTL
jgi:heat shock protein HtpX